LTFDTIVRAICKACNYHPWALGHIHHHQPLPVAQTLAYNIVGSRLDYSNTVLYGTTKWSVAKLQRVQNMLVRVVLNKQRRSHSAELLQSLHWLPVNERIDLTVALLTYKVRNSSTPDNLNCLRTNRVINCVTLRSSSKQVLHVPRSQAVCRVSLEILLLQHLQYGTDFPIISKWLTVPHVLNRVSKLFLFQTAMTVKPSGKRLCIMRIEDFKALYTNVFYITLLLQHDDDDDNNRPVK